MSELRYTNKLALPLLFKGYSPFLLDQLIFYPALSNREKVSEDRLNIERVIL